VPDIMDRLGMKGKNKKEERPGEKESKEREVREGETAGHTEAPC